MLSPFIHREERRRAKILVVEDTLPTQTMLAMLLEKHYQVLLASDSLEAMRAIEQEAPDLILLDIGLGPHGLSGVQLCELLRSEKFGLPIPIIFMTSSDDPETQQECWDAGCNDFIQKPFCDTTLLNRIKHQLTLSLQQEYLTSLAYKDALTGLYNRRHFEEQLRAQIKHHVRHKHTLTLLMLDIDHFKRINDDYGHGVGDDCLAIVARTLQLTARRPTDLVCRYGGEEFALILPETDLEGGELIARKINMRFSAPEKISRGATIESAMPKVTVSIGVACQVPGDTSESLVNRADAALYEAKQNGRNCYSLAKVYPDHPALQGAL
ncbi:diguanylate cyclase [Mangrovimicrobium sediminis]|uniref:diguanylate cyclase n=1 Tax=Mangrovimicrobium sediminis TaxID=2562682 RepID=A0A4Z0M1R7_9GAMM|nr:diguanylate cyclase [Haliea sp. SAOS-164]TGD73623.1 diguanylate cyclase [Haliea sp. SAOS-164]